MISRLKIFDGTSVKFMESLNEDAQKKKKGQYILYIRGGAILIATDPNLLDTKYKFYGFKDDLGDIIN